MPDETPAPWYRLHWLTWVVLVAQLWAIYDCRNLERFGGIWERDYDYVVLGWPFAERIWAWSRYIGRGTGSNEFFYLPLALNLSLYAAMLTATAFVLENWLQRPSIVRVGLGDMGWITFTVAALLAIWLRWPAIHDLTEAAGLSLFWVFGQWSLFDHSDPYGIFQLRTYLMLFGTACVIHVSAWALLEAVRRTVLVRT